MVTNYSYKIGKLVKTYLHTGKKSLLLKLKLIFIYNKVIHVARDKLIWRIFGITLFLEKTKSKRAILLWTKHGVKIMTLLKWE